MLTGLNGLRGVVHKFKESLDMKTIAKVIAIVLVGASASASAWDNGSSYNGFGNGVGEGAGEIGGGFSFSMNMRMQGQSNTQNRFNGYNSSQSNHGFAPKMTPEQHKTMADEYAKSIKAQQKMAANFAKNAPRFVPLAPSKFAAPSLPQGFKTSAEIAHEMEAKRLEMIQDMQKSRAEMNVRRTEMLKEMEASRKAMMEEIRKSQEDFAKPFADEVKVEAKAVTKTEPNVDVEVK